MLVGVLLYHASLSVDAATAALRAGPTLSLPAHDLGILAAWAIAALLASLRLFRWEPRAARQAGADAERGRPTAAGPVPGDPG